MTELVPQNASPIRWAFALRCRAVCCDHAAKTNPQKTSAAGQSERADRKILLLGKDFDDDRRVGCHVILFAQHLAGFAEQFDDIVTVDRSFTRIHPDVDIVGFDGAEFADAIVQGDQVMRDHIVFIRFGDRVRQLPTGFFFAKPQ